MTLDGLRCKECGSEYPLEALYVCDQCFGPLEVAYDYSSLDAESVKRKIQAGSDGIWRYADFLPFAGQPGERARARPDAAVRADRLAEQLGVGEVWIKNDAANPTHSFKDRVVAVALAKALELGFDTVACASTGNLANAVAAHAAAAGVESYVFVPADLEEQKLLATDVYGTTLVGVDGDLRRRQPALHRARRERGWAFVNVNLRPYYAEGSKTLAYETAEQLGWRLPDKDRLPDRVGLAVHEDRPRLRRVARARAGRGRPAGLPRRPGGRLRPGRDRVRRRDMTSAARSRPTRSRRAWRSGPRRRPLRARSGAPHRRLGRRRSPTTRSAPGSACSPRPPGSSPRPPAASPPRRWRSSPRRARSVATTASSSTSPARA